MNLQRLRGFAITAVMATALGAGMIAVPPAYADSPNAKCQREIERREEKLEQAIRKHGVRSHQAEQRRHDLNAERERCWNAYHGWWNGRDRQWHTDRDWDRDHDRDDHDRDDHDRDDRH